jgi:hypothetical protein
MAAALTIGLANSAPPENADPRFSDWFNSLRQPGTGVSCCSISDCRPVDYQTNQDHYEVWIADQWRPVPNDKVLQRYDNPTGRAVVCWTPALGVMCFVKAAES